MEQKGWVFNAPLIIPFLSYLSLDTSCNLGCRVSAWVLEVDTEFNTFSALRKEAEDSFAGRIISFWWSLPFISFIHPYSCPSDIIWSRSRLPSQQVANPRYDHHGAKQSSTTYIQRAQRWQRYPGCKLSGSSQMASSTPSMLHPWGIFEESWGFVFWWINDSERPATKHERSLVGGAR